MANVMLTSNSTKDPRRPFILRVDDVCAQFDVFVTECLKLLQSEENFRSDPMNDAQIVCQLEQFNSVCDELYKEILKKKEKLLHIMENGSKSTDLRRQIQVAGSLVGAVAEFRTFLEKDRNL